MFTFLKCRKFKQLLIKSTSTNERVQSFNVLCSKINTKKYGFLLNYLLRNGSSKPDNNLSVPEQLSMTDLGKITEILCEGDEKKIKRLKDLQFEFEVWKSSGFNVPSRLCLYDFKNLMEEEDPAMRKKLMFTFVRREKMVNMRLYRKERELAYAKMIEDRVNKYKKLGINKLVYGVGANCIIPDIKDQYVYDNSDYNCIPALQFSQPLVFDFSYSKYMNDKNLTVCAKQVTDSFRCSRDHIQPFNIQVCNFQRRDRLTDSMLRGLPRFLDKDFCVNITEKSYLDLYPKEKLVYLSPHSEYRLTEYNHDDVYIIGAFADTLQHKYVSPQIIKKYKLRHAALPIDLHVKNYRGIPNLAIHVVVKILLDMRHYGDWKIAFRNLNRLRVNTTYLPSKKVEDMITEMFLVSNY